MTISSVNVGTKYENAGNTTGTATPTLPGGGGAPAAGDLIIAQYCCRNAGVTFTTPTDFTLARAFTGATYPAGRLCYKIAVGGDANPASDWSGGAANATVVAQVVVFKSTVGFHATTPLPDIPANWDAGVGGDIGPVTGMTPSAGADGVVIFAGIHDDVVPTALGGSWTPVYQSGSALGTDGGVICEWQAWTSGAIANTSWAVAGSPNWSGIMVSIQEVVVASTVKPLAALGVG